MPSGFDFKADRLLDPIALVGGAKAPVYDTFVRLSVDYVTATMLMQRLVSARPRNFMRSRPMC
jgi:hypothetical protein